jgi:hypothetical protein
MPFIFLFSFPQRVDAVKAVMDKETKKHREENTEIEKCQDQKRHRNLNHMKYHEIPNFFPSCLPAQSYEISVCPGEIEGFFPENEIKIMVDIDEKSSHKKQSHLPPLPVQKQQDCRGD